MILEVLRTLIEEIVTNGVLELENIASHHEDSLMQSRNVKIPELKIQYPKAKHFNHIFKESLL